MGRLKVLGLAATFVVSTACTCEDGGGATTSPAASAAPEFKPTPYVVKLPPEVRDMPVPKDNPLTKEGVELGRYLFYDRIMSGDNSISCGTCHLQARAFTDGRMTAQGVRGQKVRRNTMALVNLAWSAPYFWDGRAKTLEELVPIPIQEPTEMDQKMDALVGELEQHSDYPSRFARAFPGEPISTATISKAVAQFLRILVSFDAPIDRLDRGEYKLSEPEKRGQQLLSGKLPLGAQDGRGDLCDSCHSYRAGLKKSDGMGMFTDASFRNNGIGPSEDLGRGEVTTKSQSHLFKVPTIRNVAVTGPYMHDGRFGSLDQVLMHYNESILPSADKGLHFKEEPVRLGLSQDDIRDIIASLALFTDQKFLKNPEFSDPFQKK